MDERQQNLVASTMRIWGRHVGIADVLNGSRQDAQQVSRYAGVQNTIEGGSAEQAGGTSLTHVAA